MPKYEHNTNTTNIMTIMKTMASQAGIVPGRQIYVLCESVSQLQNRIYLRRCGRLCMHTLLSTDIDSTAASVSLEIGGPSSLVMGRNCNPVTNIE